MMSVVIGLGSNLQRPLQQLRNACKKLQQEFTISAYSDIYQSAALVPENSPKEWRDKIYLNAAVKITTSLSPQDVLKKLKQIESDMGRNSKEKWAPRIIDLDILVFAEVKLTSPELNLPHQELNNRAFALLPLWDVLPEYQHPQLSRSDLEKTAEVKKLPHLLAGPQIMGILNVTPDSFADGGKYLEPEAALKQAQKLFNEGADIIDIGAESTRPQATLLTEANEWQRLEPVLKAVQQHYHLQEHRPLISIDTRHAATIQKALAFGIDWINDVSGEEFSLMQPLLHKHNLKYVAMHHLGVPPKSHNIIQGDPIEVLLAFQTECLERFKSANLPPEQLILDPGIGFGKSIMQQLAIINRFHELGTSAKWLIGHARKSFLKGLLVEPNEEAKETATAMISAHLSKQGVDYLRVHAPGSSLAAIRLSKVLLST